MKTKIMKFLLGFYIIPFLLFGFALQALAHFDVNAVRWEEFWENGE